MFPKGTMIEVALYDDHIEMTTICIKGSVSLKYSQITNVTYNSHTKKLLFLITYTSSSGEEKLLQFHDTRMYKGFKVQSKLKELCEIHEPILDVNLVEEHIDL